MAPFADVVPEIAEFVGEVAFDPDSLRERYRQERDKRLRPDGNDQYVEVKGDFAHYVDDPYVEPGFTREPLFDHVDVAIVGAGFGGLLAAARLREAGLERIRLIDRAGDVGGTWYWNRYPGAACDVESYIYLPLLEEMGYVPRHRYSYAPEIAEHCRNIARRFELYEDACFQTSVTEVTWDEQRRHWVIGTDRGDRMTAQFVVSAPGPLSRPKLPGIPGIDDFAGHTFHTSRWDYGYTGGDPSGGLTGVQGKRVGVIGTGATAIQCVPYLAEWAEQLYVFQRTPSSVDFRGQTETDEDWFRSQEQGWQRRRMQNFTSLVSGGEEEVDLVGDGWTDIFRNLTGHAAKGASRALGRRLTPEEKYELIEMFDFRKMEQIRSRVADIVSDPATAEALKPWYRQFCKRPCYHDDYLHAFNRPNVTLVDTGGRGVERMTRDAVVVDGREYEVDCLIFATGFEVGTALTRRTGYDIAGRDGVPLSEAWRDGVRTVHGLQSRGFPNLFFIGFLQSAFTVNLVHALDEQARHLAYIIDQVRSRGHGIVEATEAGEDAWVGEVQRTAIIAERFYSECTPGYYNNEGQVTRNTGFFAGQYGGGPVRFFEILRRWREEGALAGLELS